MSATVTADPVPSSDRRLLDGPQELPAAVDVAVLGGGLAALRVAVGLAASGASVAVLCEDDDLGADESARCEGQLVLGTHDRPCRLEEAVGPEQARALLRFSARSVSAALALGGRPGGLEVAWNPAESRDLEASVAVLEAAGVAVSRLDAAQVAAATDLSAPVAEGTSALFLPGTGAVVPRAVLDGLWRAAQKKGVVAAAGVRVVQAQPGRVDLADGSSLAAEVVVFAGDWRHKRTEAWFADKLYPVRHQHQLREGPAPQRPWSTQGGYLQGTPRAGGLVVSGARWATQHLEAGETDCTVVQTAVSAAQDRYVAQCVAPWASRPVVARWSHISTHTCDNLPLVGPVPGRPALVACVGWNGRPWSWALAAADAVVQGLLEGRPEGVPRMVLPSRLL